MQFLTGSLAHLRRPFTTNVRPGQQVLVLTDTRHDPRVWQAVMSILSEIGADTTLAMFDPRPADYYDPPAAVCEAMLRTDFNVLLASTGMLHAPANMRAMAAGIPALCFDGGMTLEMLQSGGITEDGRQMAVRKHWIGKRVFGATAKTCRVTSSQGSDLAYSVEGRIGQPRLPDKDFDPYRVVDLRRQDGREGGFPLLFCLLPGGEFNVAPMEGSANGRLVVDLTIHQIGRVLTPIVLHVEDGVVAAIEGGAEARMLRDYLETYGDKNAYRFPAEASIGVNRKALIRGIQREDKNIYGAMHFGLGTNIDVGGSVLSRIHMDGIVLAPTLLVDGVTRLEEGRFLVDIEGE